MEIGQRLLLLSGFGQVFGESTIVKLTKTRATLENGLQFYLDDLTFYGKGKYNGITPHRVVIPTPNYELKFEDYKKAIEEKKKLANAKVRLADHIDHMRSQYFGQCTSDQIYAALESLDEIFGEKQ